MDSDAYRDIFLVTGSIDAYNSYTAAKRLEDMMSKGRETNAACDGRDSAEKH